MPMNPRCSADPFLQRALEVWDQVSLSRYPCCEATNELLIEFQSAGARQAIGWLSLICGRVAACNGELTVAETYLIDASGRLHFSGDKYGEGLADSHMAIVVANRGESETAVKLAESAFLLSVEYSSLDLAILHNIAAMANWFGGKCAQALGHILSEFEIIRKSGRVDRHAAVLANLSAVLLELGDFRLALAASRKALALHQSLGGNPSQSHLSALSNVALSCYLLGRYAEARVHGISLFKLLSSPNSPATSQLYLNLVEAFCSSGEIELAEEALQRARTLSNLSPTNFSPAHLLIGDAAVREAKRDYEGAVTLTRNVLSFVPGVAKQWVARQRPISGAILRQMRSITNC
jgi:tetratricopeptide (TPR) repeat protein